MGTDTFRRHTRARVDAAIHHIFVSIARRPHRRSFFERLLRAVRERSELTVQALGNLLWFERATLRAPEDWSGASGHHLQVVDSLARHLFGAYPTPRFLASVWFGGGKPADLERRHWFIAHARGRRFRDFALPITMTRRMEDEFLRTPDHLTVSQALRRAEVLGLGGTPALADALVATRLGHRFEEGERWRAAIQWLVGRGDTVDLDQVRPIVDFLEANLCSVSLRGRSFASLMRRVGDWHVQLARQRAGQRVWPRSSWRELAVTIAPTRSEPRRSEWTIVELCDQRALTQEGRAMRHCVSTYARYCLAGRSSIWSVRQRWSDEDAARSVLTVEVYRRTGTIVQLRARSNGRAGGWPLALVRRWARREGLSFVRGLPVDEAALEPWSRQLMR